MIFYGRMCKMPLYILITASIILICIFFGKLSGKIGIPTLLLFIFLGMLFGSDGLFKINFDNYAFAEQICSIALIFIMFYGGFGTNWSKAKPTAVKALLLSGPGVVITAGITGIFCFFVLKFDFMESMLIGAVVSSTDAASVFAVLRSKKLNLKYNTASLLEIESGSNDPFSYMLTVIILSYMGAENQTANVTYMIFAQIIFGAFTGIMCALAASYILSRCNLAENGFDSIFVFGTALISYSLASVIGGNGYLSVYITGIILGNKQLVNKKALVHFFDGFTGLMQMLIFFLLGLLAFPSQLPGITLSALAIALFLTFVARPIAVFLILTPFKCPLNQQLLICWSGLRGAASIVFAIMARLSPAYTKFDIFHIVFFIVLFSISIQGALIPIAARKLKMIDNNDDVMKTFNDYSDEIPIRFIRLHITQNHPWISKKIKNIKLLPDVILVLVVRNGEQIIPRGNTEIFEGDEIIVSGLAPDDGTLGYLTEVIIDKDNSWCGKTLSDIKMNHDRLIVLIMRNGKTLIPSGKTKIKENDVLIINQS